MGNFDKAAEAGGAPGRDREVRAFDRPPRRFSRERAEGPRTRLDASLRLSGHLVEDGTFAGGQGDEVVIVEGIDRDVGKAADRQLR